MNEDRMKEIRQIYILDTPVRIYKNSQAPVFAIVLLRRGSS
jgi:hypothetical protein